MTRTFLASTRTMPWLQLSLDLPPEQVPLLELTFGELGALSVTLGDAGNAPLLEPDPGTTPLWQRTRVTALFDGDRDPAELRRLIERSLHPELSRGIHISRLEDQLWERLWLDDFHPMCFGRRLWVCPAGEVPDATDAVLVKMDPGLAFGTGTHPTTALCLRWLDAADLQNKSLCDWGCGSGILAIAGLRLGAASAVAVDHDPQALTATRDNATRNEVLERLQIYDSAGAPPMQTDILLANILAEPLIGLRKTLSGRVKPGGSIILSGILDSQAPRVSQAFAPDFELEAPVVEGEWVLLEGQRRPLTTRAEA